MSSGSRKSSSSSSRSSPTFGEGPDFIFVSQEYFRGSDRYGREYTTKQAIEQQFEALAKKINSYIKVGYRPHSSIFKEQVTLYQAMLRDS
jgi:hypothetical protein